MLFFNLLAEMRNSVGFLEGHAVCGHLHLHCLHVLWVSFPLLHDLNAQLTHSQTVPVLFPRTIHVQHCHAEYLALWSTDCGQPPFHHWYARHLSIEDDLLITWNTGGLIAAALYGNIGIKVIYNNVFVELFCKLCHPRHTPAHNSDISPSRFPDSRHQERQNNLGRNGSHVRPSTHIPPRQSHHRKSSPLTFHPQALVPRLHSRGRRPPTRRPRRCLLQQNFTYAFPALLKIGFDIKKGAMLEGESFDQVTKKYTPLDRGVKRWMRGYRKTVFGDEFQCGVPVGALVVCGLGCYSAISAPISACSGGTSTISSSCVSPYAG